MLMVISWDVAIVARVLWKRIQEYDQWKWKNQKVLIQCNTVPIRTQVSHHR